MKIQKILSAIVGSVLLFNARAVNASMASGTYSVDVGADVPLWDLSEYYNSNVGIGGLEFTIAQEPSGTFTGTGDLYIEDYGVSLDMPAVISGKVSGSSKDPKVLLDGLATFSGEYDGAYFNYLDATIKLTMQLDSAVNEILGKGSGTVKYSAQNETTGKTAKGSKSAPTGGVGFSLPSDVTGDWNLTLNLIPNGTKYTGTAEVVTSVGDAVDFTATGTYSASKDTSSITLKGTGPGAGTSLSLVISTSGSAINIVSLKGKLFGQTLSYKAP